MSIFRLSRSGSKRDTQLKILITAEEKASLDEAASRLDMTTSDLVRDAVNEYLERRKKQKKSRRTP